MHIGQWCALGQEQILAADMLAVRAAHQNLRQGIVVVLVAVAHVRAIEEQRVVENAAIAIWAIGQLLQETCKTGNS